MVRLEWRSKDFYLQEFITFLEFSYIFKTSSVDEVRSSVWFIFDLVRDAISLLFLIGKSTIYYFTVWLILSYILWSASSEHLSFSFKSLFSPFKCAISFVLSSSSDIKREFSLIRGPYISVVLGETED